MWKCSFSSFCVEKMESHPAQVNLRGFTYFLLSLYSTVLKTFFWDWGVVTLPAGCSIFIAVPMTRGSMGGLMSGSNRPSTLGTTCGCHCSCGAIGRVVSLS